MSTDPLYDSAFEYTKLMNYEFEIQYIVRGRLMNATIKFDDGQFSHLTGIQKLKDRDYKTTASGKILKNILKHKMKYADLQTSSYFSNPTNSKSLSLNKTEYYISDRIDELKRLYDYLHNMTLNNTKMYNWKRNTSTNNRPYKSEISADVGFEFKKNSNSKVSDEKCCLFLNLGKDNTLISISLFPTDVNYFDDGKIAEIPFKILSVVEIDKINQVSIDIIKVSEAELEEARIKSNEIMLSKKLTDDLATLKKIRNKYIKTNIDTKYTAYLNKLLSLPHYTADNYKDLKKRLESQYQDTNDEKTKGLIENEIKKIDKRIYELEHSDTIRSESISIGIKQETVNGSAIMKSTIEVPIPKIVNKTKMKTHDISHKADNIITSLLSDISNFISEAIDLFKKKDNVKKAHKKVTKPPERKNHVNNSSQENEAKKKTQARFSLSDLNNPKYAQKSQHKGKSKTKDHNIDL